MHTLEIMDISGDTKIHWDPASPASVEAAQLAFNNYRAQGCLAFAMSSGTQGEQLDSFDPSVASVIMIPPMQGG